MWRTVLKATEYECPVVSLPVAVQVDLDVCLRGALPPWRGDPPMIGHEYDRNYVVTTASATNAAIAAVNARLLSSQA